MGEQWSPPGFDVAQICPKGHVVNATFHHCSEAREEFCQDHGLKTITDCPLGHPIQGVYINKKNKPEEDPYGFKAPRYCSVCGRAYPWTEEKLKQLAKKVTTLAKSDGFSDEDVGALAEAIPEVGTADAESSSGALSTVSRFIARMTPATAKTVFEAICKAGSDIGVAVIKHHLGYEK